MCRQEQMIRWSSQKHQEQSLACWGCADKEKQSDDLYRNIKSSHIQAEDVQIKRNSQIIFTEASTTVTCMLRRHRQEEMITQKHQKQSLTSWGCAHKEKWSDDLHGSIKNSHLHAKEVQTRRNNYMIFTKMHWGSHLQAKDGRMIFTEASTVEQSLTSWGCTNKEKSHDLHRKP